MQLFFTASEICGVSTIVVNSPISDSHNQNHHVADAIDTAYELFDNDETYAGVDAFYGLGDFSSVGGEGDYVRYVDTLREHVREETVCVNILGNHEMKDDNDVSYFMLSDLDPFIIVNNNGLNTEVHTYVNKYTEAIWHYTTGKSSKEDHVAWALLIPDASFHYPIEGNPIGRYRNGEIYGAYSRYNHSFGQWGRNCQSSLDWWHYDYATKAQVY